MEMRRTICEELRIPWSYVNVVSDEDKATCLVHESWLQKLLRVKVLPAEFTRHDTFGDLECELLLQHRQARTRAPWKIIEIKVIAKTDSAVCGLPHFKKPNKSNRHDLTYSQLLHYISETNYRNLWKDAYKHYVSSYSGKKSVIPDKTHHFYSVIREALLRLYACPIIPLQTKEGGGQTFSKDIEPNSLNGIACHQNVLPAYCILESSDHFHVVQPHVEHTLYDCLTFSPAVMSNSNMKPLFIVYQMLELVRDLHDRGLCLGDVNLCDVGVDANLWIRVRPKIWQGVSATGPAAAVLATRKAARCEVAELGIEGGVGVGVGVSDRGATPSPDAPSNSFCHIAPPTFLDDACRRLRRHSLGSLTERWTRHEISNFDYLLVLNRLAGRHSGNPNYHPVLPWVMDFTVPNGGWRDLTKSKFRLNKGDRQLDLTYEMLPPTVTETTTSGGVAATAVPHHVTDVLSEITYYVYRARQTPRSVLCRYVRPNWVPAEYPSSMQRLFEWTPDECIPEFFSDPTIFCSTHDDLPDLEVPWWASSPADFVTRHRQALESPHVSERLHHWIDLTFGYKLSGPAAIKARNVCLHLVDQHTGLACDGVVQLFAEPHPPRLSSTHNTIAQAPGSLIAPQSLNRRERPRVPEEAGSDLQGGSRDLSDIDVELRNKLAEKRRTQTGRSRLTSLNDVNKPDQRPDAQTIVLPKDFSTLARLNQLEALYNFTAKTTYKTPQSKHSLVSEAPHSFSRQRTRDMIVVGCVVAEIFLAKKLCALDSKASLEQRYQLICAFLKTDMNELPRCVRSAVKLLLHLDPSRSVVGGRWEIPSRVPSVTCGGLPPPSAHQLLQPLVQVLPFPSYFPLTFDFICRMRSYSERIAWDQLMRSDISAGAEEPAATDGGWEQLAETKVKMTAAALPDLLPRLNEEGLGLLTPYLRDLFDEPDTALMAAWYLLNVVGRALGPSATARCLVEPLVRLLNAERTTAKHMKLFHRSYLLQLIVRLGLNTFLAHFTNILIEAVGGFKDFGTGEGDSPVSGNTGRKSSHRRSPDLDSLIQYSDPRDGDETLEETLSPFDENLSQTEIVSPWTKSDSENVDFSRTEQDTLTEPEIFVFEAAGDDFDNGDARRNEADADLLEQLGQKFGENSSGSTSDDAVSISHSPTTADDDQLHSYGGAVDIKSDGQPPPLSANPSSFSEGFPMPRATTRLRTLEPVYSASVPNLSSAFLVHPQPEAAIELAETCQGDDVGAGPSSATEQVRSSQKVVTAYNVADVAMESVVWLTHRLGPVLTAKHLGRNLLKMTSLCYIRDDYLEYVATPGDSDTTTTESAITISPRKVVGDKGSQRVFDCLSIIASLYGEQFILLQYFPHMVEIVSQSKKRITSGCEAGLVGSLSLVHYIVPYLSDATLMDNLQDALIKDILYPIVRLISSQRHLFPTGGHARQVIAFKLLDALYLIGLRIGFEMTRKHLTAILRRFFAAFSRVHNLHPGNVVQSFEKHGKEVTLGTDLCDSSNSSPSSGISAFQSHHGRFKASCDSMSPPVGEKDGQSIETLAKEELSQAFTCELAYHAYISFCKLAGSIHLGRSLGNEELIHQLCLQYDRGLDTSKPVLSDETIPPQILSLSLQTAGVAPKTKETVSDVRQNVEVIGNRIDIRLEEDEDSVTDCAPLGTTALIASDRAGKSSDYPKCDISKLISKQMDNEFRHLKGNWFAYWEHEIGRSEKDYRFNFKQIKLQTFVGHSGGIRTIHILDNENSFISASKDKTVKLWSLRSHGDGLYHSPCQWTYSNHKKSVFSVIFLESLRLAASCDSTVHIWDPFMGSCIKVFDSAKNPPVTVLTAMPAPSSMMVTATTESTIRFMDARILRYMHDYKVSLGPAGLIRCLAVSPNGLLIGVGHSSGIISIIDVRTGMISSSWKGHEGEILQIKAFNNNTFVTSSVDQCVSVWNADDGKLKCHLRGPTEPVHCFNFYRNEMISGTTANRICVHTSVDSQASFSSTRLRSDTFKGMLTSLTVLPLNRLLLLGGEKGTIKLLC